MAKNPNYEADSEALRVELEELEAKTLEDARRELSTHTVNAMKRLGYLAHMGTPDDAVKLGATKHILKLAGMEIEKVDLNAKGKIEVISNVPMKFEDEHGLQEET